MERRRGLIGNLISGAGWLWGVRASWGTAGVGGFKSRVAKSNFTQMPHFAKFTTGAIALQGDHGQIFFRNIKLRPIKSEN